MVEGKGSLEKTLRFFGKGASYAPEVWEYGRKKPTQKENQKERGKQIPISRQSLGNSGKTGNDGVEKALAITNSWEIDGGRHTLSDLKGMLSHKSTRMGYHHREYLSVLRWESDPL